MKWITFHNKHFSKEVFPDGPDTLGPIPIKETEWKKHQNFGFFKHVGTPGINGIKDKGPGKKFDK